MLADNHIPILQARLKAFIDLNPPATFLKRYILFLAFLEWSGVVPSSEEAGFALLVQAVVNGDFVEAGGGHELF